MKTLKDISLTDAAYAAGFFDGEGCVGVYRKKIGPRGINPRHALVISIANTNFEVLHHFHVICGGVVQTPSRCYDKRPNRLPVGKWSAQAREAGHILKALAPFLVVKKAQALLAIEFADITAAQIKGKRGMRQCRPLSPADLAYRESVYERLKAMKRQPNP